MFPKARLARALLRAGKIGVGVGKVGKRVEEHHAAVTGAIGVALGREANILGAKKWIGRMARHPGWVASVAAKRSGRAIKAHPIATGLAAASIGQSVYQDVREHKIARNVEAIRKRLGA